MTVQSAAGGAVPTRLIGTPKPKAASATAGLPLSVDVTAAACGAVALLAPKDVARMLGISVKALEKWRSQGQGPAVMRLTSKTLRYHLADVEAYIVSSRSS